MKRITIIAYLIIIIAINANATRIISNIDIARWYLDSDLVLICSAYKIDTLYLCHYDSLTHNSLRLTYDIIREIYYINIDSIIKSVTLQHEKIDSIYSQDFSINYAKIKQSESVVYKVNHSGDTIGVDTLGIITMFGTDYSDNSYFRLDMGKKHLVILSLTPNGYVIDYESELSESILKLIKEVHNKGQAYIDDFFKMD
jgi:hypothetical protein